MTLNKEDMICNLQKSIKYPLDTCWERNNIGYVACVFFWRNSNNWFVRDFEAGGYCEVLDRRVTKKAECTEYDFTKKLIEVL